MMMSLCEVTFLLITYWLLSDQVEGAEICYKRLDCFSDEPPWSQTPHRRLAPLPWSPDQIGTRFLLLTRENPQHYQEISIPGIRNFPFSPNRKTVFVVHGLADRAEGGWVSELIQEILQVEDVNGVGVDWHGGAGNISIYAQATSNARVVGREIAFFLKSLQEELQYSPSMVHIIGHSLGAHVAGEAGRACPGIGRITGLDPARPYFEGTPKEVHLDASDANFVDIIHTDTDPLLGLGMRKATGHHDYYPNGGHHMTGCPNKLAFLTSEMTMVEAMACNHLRAPLYYRESIRNPTGFYSYPCEDYPSFLEGLCFPCPPTGCPTMGHYAELSPDPTTGPLTFYLHTGGDTLHFSSHRYKVSVSLVGNQKISGKISISLFGDGRASPDYDIVSGTLLPGNVYSGFVDSEAPFGDIICMDFRWTLLPLQFNLFIFQLGADRVEIQSGEDGSISAFCSSPFGSGGGAVQEGRLLTLGPCESQRIWDPTFEKRAADWL